MKQNRVIGVLFITAILAVASVSVCFCVSSSDDNGNNDSNQVSKIDIERCVKDISREFNRFKSDSDSANTIITELEKEQNQLDAALKYYVDNMESDHPELRQMIFDAYDAADASFSAFREYANLFEGVDAVFTEMMKKVDVKMTKDEIRSFVDGMKTIFDGMDDIVIHLRDAINVSENANNLLKPLADRLEADMGKVDGMEYVNFKILSEEFTHVWGNNFVLLIGGGVTNLDLDTTFSLIKMTVSNFEELL